MTRTKTAIRVDRVDSFASLISELKQLDNTLPKLGLERLTVFNTAYLVITEKIASGAQQGYFGHPKFIEKFTLSFAQYYLDAIRDMAVGSPSLGEAWQLTYKAASEANTPRAVVLLMGANAHINHDLPLVLAHLISEKRAKELFTDVLKVDKLLMKSGKAIIPMFREESRWQNWVKDNVRFLYYRPTMWMVLYWRIRAWQHSRSIVRHGLDGNDYANRSVRIAKRLNYIGRFFA